MNDQFIINELKKGNTNAFSMVYQCYPMIEKHICKNSGTTEDAQDIFHNGLIIFYEKVKTNEFRLEAKISTYVFAICKNIWLKKLRKKSSHKAVELEEHHQLVEETSNKNEEGIITLVRQKLNELGNPCKELILMHEFHKMDWQSISSKMGYATAHAARNQKYKCLQRMKKLIPSETFRNLINA